MAREIPFGFVVQHAYDYDENDHKIPTPDDRWRVHLPHQCGEWDIAGDEAPHETAVANLGRFIAEAQSALQALNERREVGVDE